MNQAKGFKRILAAGLAALLVFFSLGAAPPAQAETEPPCENHARHDDTCGFVEAVAGSPCTFAHVHVTEGEHACGYDGQNADNCTFDPATHVHDAACGYVAAVDGMPCTHTCELCAPAQSPPVPQEEPATPDASPAGAQSDDGLLGIQAAGDCTFSWDAAYAAYLGSGRSVRVWAKLSEIAAQFDDGTYGNVRLVHENGVDAVNASDISGDQRSVLFVLNGETAPAGTWELDGFDEARNPLSGTVLLEDAASVLSLSLTGLTKTDSANPLDRRFIFDFTILNGGGQTVAPASGDLVEVRLATQPQLVPGGSLYHIPGGTTLPAYGQLDMASTVELQTAPAGYAGPGFVPGIPQLYYNNKLVASPVSSPVFPATQYILPVAGADGYIPQDAIPSDVAGVTLTELLRHDGINPADPAGLFPSTAPIPRYAANRFDEALIYDYTNLSGISLGFLSYFPNIAELGLWGCNLDNADFASLPALAKLQVLDIDDNDITDLSPLARLTALRFLYADDNGFGNLSPLAPLTELDYLSLSGNAVSDVAPLAGLTKLTQLFLDENQIADVSPLAGLVNLEILGLGNNQITNIAPLAGFAKLTHLNIWYNQISEIPLTAAQLGQLKLFTFSGNPLKSLAFLNQMNLADPDILVAGMDMMDLAQTVDISPDGALRTTAASLLPNLPFAFTLYPEENGSVTDGAFTWAAPVNVGDVRHYGFGYWSDAEFDAENTTQGIFLDGTATVTARAAPTPAPNTGVPQTGDGANPAPWFGFGLLTLAGLGGLLAWRRRLARNG